ncbi:MAG: glutathione S-transferase [Rhodocyclaceae bacterium]|nr:glutathione S-transferase [Rhodocyclaceae bacterium]
MATCCPILYSFRRCPYAMRARWALAAAGLSVELREVVLSGKPAEMLAASSKGTVPVLIDVDNRVIDESLDIMLWALRQSDPARWLVPQGGALDDMLCLIAQCDGEFKFNLDRYKYPQRYGIADAKAHRAVAMNYLLSLNARLQTVAYLFGDLPSLADIAIAPFVRQFALTDSTWFNQQAWPALRHWLDELIESPMFALVMTRHLRWQPGDVPVTFRREPRQRRPVHQHPLKQTRR